MDTLKLRDAWLRAEARDRGFEVLDTDACDIEVTTEGDGCCEMCYSEVAVLNAKVGKARFQISTY